MKRYYVREGHGYTEQGQPFTELTVLDRDYCHRVVWSSYSSITVRRHNGQLSTARKWPIALARRFAKAAAARLNAGRALELPVRTRYYTHDARETRTMVVERWIAS